MLTRETVERNRTYMTNDCRADPHVHKKQSMNKTQGETSKNIKVCESVTFSENTRFRFQIVLMQAITAASMQV